MKLKSLKYAVKARIETCRNRVVLSGAAVSHEERVIVISGFSGSGKTALTAWLISKGFGYLTDKLVLFSDSSFEVECFAKPMVFPEDMGETLLQLMGVDQNLVQRDQAKIMVPESAFDTPDGGVKRAALMLFPHFETGADLTLWPLSPGKSATAIISFTLNARTLPKHGFPQAARMARTIPACRVTYGDMTQFEGVLDLFIRLILENELNYEKLMPLIKAFNCRKPGLGHAATAAPTTTSEPKSTQPSSIPVATPKGKKRKLTIGMAAYDDFDGVYFSIQAIRLYHPEVTDETEIIAIDNNPAGPAAGHLKAMDQKIKHFRYIPMREKTGSAAAKEAVFQHANSEYVLCMDCHVLIEPGAIAKLLAYFDAYPDSRDLFQGPLLDDGLTSVLTHFNPKWGTGMYGVWGHDRRGDDPDNDPFEIKMQGMGLFACKKEHWLGFNPNFRGFGGEEGYIHEKFRQAGAKTLCLPFLRWTHRFARPMGVPYPINWEDRVFNYLIGFSELGLDTAPVFDHFNDHLGEGATAVYEAIKEADKVHGNPTVYRKKFSSIVKQTYERHRQQPSDIHEHLPTIRAFSKGRNHVVELGVRDAVSTWAILAGRPQKVTACDIARHANIDHAMNCAAGQGTGFTFIEADSRQIDIEPAEVMLVDTLHAYKQLYTELVRHADKISHAILIHGTVSFADTDMVDVYKLDPGLFVDCPDKKGLITAIDDFIKTHPQWVKHQHFTHNNGLMVLKRARTNPPSPFISCICPTYKRPDMLQNALACFLAQNYPKDRCELLICDDAGQFHPQEGENWKLTSSKKRYPNLPYKYNETIRHAKGEIIAIWEDDDIFLPWMLKEVAECYQKGDGELFFTKKVWTTCGQPLGEVILENNTTGRFHSSWRYTKALFDRVGGYPDMEALAFDMEFGHTLRQAAKGTQFYNQNDCPGYVYRWGNGHWHGSQQGDGEAYASLWKHLGSLPAPKIGKLEPKFDEETTKIYQHLITLHETSLDNSDMEPREA